MKPRKAQFFTIGSTIYISTLAPISIDNYAGNCVECGKHTVEHIADVIQYGLFADKCTSVFVCENCGHTFHFTYAAMARAQDTYIPLDGVTHGDNGQNESGEA